MCCVAVCELTKVFSLIALTAIHYEMVAFLSMCGIAHSLQPVTSSVHIQILFTSLNDIHRPH